MYRYTKGRITGAGCRDGRFLCNHGTGGHQPPHREDDQGEALGQATMNRRERQQMNKMLWEKAVAFHGHECPGLAIGFKACEAAAEKLGIGVSDDEEIVCITENDACGVDAVQALLSCTMGKGNLIYRGTGKMAFSFFDRRNGKSLRVCLRPGKNEGMEKTEWKEYLLNASVDEIFTFSRPRLEPPERARLFNTVICEMCGEGAAEHKMHLQDGKFVCDDCCYGYTRGWPSR